MMSNSVIGIEWLVTSTVINCFIERFILQSRKSWTELHVVTLLCSTSVHDVDIITGDGVTLACHKCVLDARVQYFHGLFASTWIEVLCSQ